MNPLLTYGAQFHMFIICHMNRLIYFDKKSTRIIYPLTNMDDTETEVWNTHFGKSQDT